MHTACFAETQIIYHYRYKDGQEVRADARIKITRDCTRLETYNLTLNLIKREDAGDYEVKATNVLGTASTKSHVKVLSKFILINRGGQIMFS